MRDLTVFFAAFLLTALLVYWLRPLAHRLGLVDFPSGRKHHNHPTPVVGGIAMVACLLAFLPLLPPVLASAPYLGMSLALICVSGIFDDLRDLSARLTFLFQIAAALIMTIPGGLCVEGLGDLFGFGLVHIGPVKVVFTVICVLGVINAINMADGLDGLAGSLVLVAGAWYAVLAWLSGAVAIQSLALLLLGSVAGFLLFNLPTPWRGRASVFMGDAGSMPLGLLLTWLAVALSGRQGSGVTPITAVWVLGLPLIDMACVMVRRIHNGLSPFNADHEHLHHVLMRAGYSAGQAVAIQAGVSALLGGVGVAAWMLHVPEFLMFYAFMVMLAAYYYFMAHHPRIRVALRRKSNGPGSPGSLSE